MSKFTLADLSELENFFAKRNLSNPAARSALAQIKNARAAGQALVFDGTSGASMTGTAFGTGSFSVAVGFTPRSFATTGYILAPSSVGPGFALVTTSGAKLQVVNYVTLNILTSAKTLVAGVAYHAEVVRLVTDVSSVTSLYIDGVLDSSVSDASDYVNPTGIIGRATDDSQWFIGSIVPPVYYNYALSAAQVRELFETGAVAAADRGGSMSAVISNTFDSESAGWLGVGGGVITENVGYATFTSTSADQRVQTTSGVDIKVGRRYRLTFEYRAASAGDITVRQYTTDLAAVTVVGDGTWRAASVEFVQVAGAYGENIALTRGAGDFDIRNLAIIPLGTLAQYEANQPGAGPQWRDVSGNGADINLPGEGVAGGVAWALPGGSAADFGETRTASGYALGRDAVVIPEGYRIARIWCSGDGTFSMGNAAAGTEVVAAFVATSTTQPATLAGYITASRKLYLTLGTATTVTYTVHLERV